MQIIGIDVGRDHVKVKTYDKQIKFKSAVGEWRERRISSGGNYEITISNDQKYFVADLAIDESRCKIENTEESKIHEETKILFLCAIGLTAISGEQLTIVTGLPINQHTPEVKHQLETLLKGDYSIRVLGNVGGTKLDREVMFSIKNILVAPEGAATYRHLTLDDSGYKNNTINRKTRIVDLGSRTVNFSTINESGRYIDRDSGTLQYGMLDLHNEDVLTEESYKLFMKRISGDLSKKWMDYSSKDYLVFTGGGSISLNKWIKEKFPTATILEDCVFSNVNGFYKMGLSQWKKQQTAK